MKLEKDLWRELKRFKSKINWTRLENRALFGTPDILGYNNSGNFFLVELKLTKVNKVRLSPHQIAFFVRHPKNSFVLVAGSPDPKLVRLYPGSRILELVNDGLRLEPLTVGLEASVAWFESLGASKILRRT